MIQLLIPSLIATMLIAGGAGAQSSTWFRKLDRNNDGHLQRAEVQSLRGVSEALDEADANHDGKLDPGEFVTAERIVQARKLPPFPQDTETADRVRQELEREPELKNAAIEVKAHRGRVRLSGTVDDENKRDTAVKAAVAVVGASNVGDTIKVR